MGKIVEQCIGCQKILQGENQNLIGQEAVCSAYRDPAMWWNKMGGCPLATHVHKKVGQEQGKVRLTIQKKKKTRK